MAGIVGMLGEGPVTADDRSVLLAAARALDHTGDGHVDLWVDGPLCVARVHLPFDRPAAPVVHPGRGTALILHGCILDQPSRMPEAAAERALALYEDRGLPGFETINGRFNLIVHDARARRLLVVNDRCASHPLFYRDGGGRLLFASQVRPLLELAGEAPRLDLSSLRQFLVFQTILTEGTFVEGVRTLPPGAALSSEDGRTRVQRYWQLRYAEDDGASEAEHAEALAAALRGAIRRGADGASGTAVLLSGGLDSRALVAVTRPSLAITLGDWENAEFGVARAIAHQRGLPQIFVRRARDFYASLVDLGPALGDGAYRFDNAHFAALRGALPAHVTDLLTGYGFDLLLKGETVPARRLHLGAWPLNRHVVRPLEAGISRTALTEVALEATGHSLWAHPDMRRVLAPAARAAFEEDVRAVVGDLLERARNHAPSPAQRCEYLRMHMMATRFPAFLNVLSIRHFYRDRAVALDNEIVDQHLRIPPRLRLDARVYKRALGRLDPQLLRIRDANTGFAPDTHYLIEHLGRRARQALGRLGLRREPGPPDPAFTQGSWPNMGELIRQRPALGERLGRAFADDGVLPGALFDVPAVQGLLADHQARRVDAAWPLLVLATVATWLRATLSRGPALLAPGAVKA
ncbi:MAG TPA: asparagine synthase-related protein [Methylomirabilota bacterium]|nr:asparagine synthase-related protein [Methylomirabilota bacterium]